MGVTVAGTVTQSRQAQPSRRRPLRRVGVFGAGPALIVAFVLFALRGFAFQPLLTNHHPDILAFWLPRFAFLGRELAAGRIPLWNPYEMIGYRFAADPQSGWLYVPPMALFSTLSPGAAMRALIVFNPLLAGLGLHWFLRKESLSRLAATAGGLSLAMLMSASEMAIEVPFAGFLAWTTIVLVGASGYRQADRWSRRLAWLALAAFAWSQVASAHMSHGLAMCSLLVTAYLIAHAIAEVRAGTIGAGAAAARVALFVIAMPLASIAILYPRLSFIGASSLRVGYGAISQTVKSAAGFVIDDRPVATNGVWAAWPLAFGAAPGAYVGATILLALPLAQRARRYRATVWALGAAFALTWVLLLNAVVAAGWFRAVMLKIPFGDVYLHNPGRLRYLSMLVIPALSAIGIQGLRDDPLPARRAARWLGVGVAVFLVLPLVAGGKPIRFILLAVGMLGAVPLLYWLATDRRRWAALGVVCVLAGELLASAIYSNVYQGGTIFTGLESGLHANLAPQVGRYPDVSEQDFMQSSRLVDILRRQPDRYLTWAPPAAYFEKGYLFTQRPQDWPALAMERGTLFGIDDALGYNPVQLLRYWSYIRATDQDLSVFYNASVINRPSLEDVRLLGIRYVIVPKGVASPLPGRVVASANEYDLVEVYGWEPRVSVVASWTVVGDRADALRGVLASGFDPGRTAYVERDPGQTPATSALPGTAVYREVTPEDVRVTVDATAPSIAVVRNSYDPGWSATVDGRPASVIPTDYLAQGVAVPTGRHEVRLVYRDRAVIGGMFANLLVWFILLGSIPVALAAERRRANRRGLEVPDSTRPV